MSKETAVAKYTVKLGNSQWSIILYGLVKLIQGKGVARLIVALLGVGIAALPFLNVFGMGSVEYVSFLTFIGGPFLIWVAVISGDDFELEFEVAKAVDEREKAERDFAKSSAPEDAVVLNLTRLNEYYAINQAQAKASFRWAVLSMLLGLVTIIVGVWLFYFRKENPDLFLTSLATVAGIVIDIVSAMFLYMYNRIQGQSLFYYKQLARSQQIATAIRLIDGYEDKKQQVKARALVIDYLLDNPG